MEWAILIVSVVLSAGTMLWAGLMLDSTNRPRRSVPERSSAPARAGARPSGSQRWTFSMEDPQWLKDYQAALKSLR